MTKHYRQRLVAVIALSFLSFTSPLVLTRNSAAENLKASKASSQEINSLIKKLKTNDERELDAAIEKLEKIGEPAIPDLIEALRDRNLLVRRSAAQILVRIGSPAIPPLVKALKNSGVRVRAAYTLGNMGAETKTAVPQLIVLLKDSDVDVRVSAAYALRNIGAEAKTALPQLVPLLKDSNANVRRSAASALGSIGAKAKTALPQLVPLLKDSNANVRSSVASALGSIGFEAKTAVPQLVPLLQDSDANVRINAAFALGSIGFEAKNAVPQLVSLLKDSEANVRDSAAFALDRIGAEAKAAVPQLVPLLKDSEFLAAKHPFLEAISGQLKSISNHPTPIDGELLQHLLQQRRILVITDHFSEMAETTQKEINPNSPDFPVNALVVTSRLDSTMRNVPKTTIHPLRIEGSELSAFMEKYLDKLGKLHLFNGSQFHYVCGDLAKLLEEIRIQGRSTTVLFAKLYADVLIAKMEGIKDENLPQNIPDLMLAYLKELNRDVAEYKLTNRTVYEDAQLLAWECLKLTYRPASTKIKDAINALSILNSQNAEQRLNYLEEKLHLLQTNLPSQENVRFVLDPVAEYLAGLHLVETYDDNENKWRDFLIDADFQNAPEAIKGFMFAVRDCYLAKIPNAKDTDFLPKEIIARYNAITAAPQSP